MIVAMAGDEWVARAARYRETTAWHPPRYASLLIEESNRCYEMKETTTTTFPQ
jgi:hypothetical protein